MLRVSISQARAGMRLALPVRHPERGTILLADGFCLEDSLIQKLHEMNVREFWIEYPDTEQIKKFVSPVVLQQQANLIGTVANLFDHVHQQAYAVLDFSHYRRTLQGLIESLVSDPTAATYIVQLGGTHECDLRHSSEVCFLSLLLGLKLQGYLVQQRKRLQPVDARNVVSLGLGAMLHDIGMASLSSEVRDRYERTRDESDPLWREHVVIGHKMVSGTVPPAASGVVLHHHQHYDGTGFPVSVGEDGRPWGLIGEDIHVFARIVCVANHFDRLRQLGDGTVQPRVRVLKNMLTGPLASRFDPVVLNALPQVVPAYPPGSIVRLNSHERCAVIHWHPDSPCQPVVRTIPEGEANQHRAGYKSTQYDLRNRTDLSIVEHDGIDVSNDNFRLFDSPPIHQKNAA